VPRQARTAMIVVLCVMLRAVYLQVLRLQPRAVLRLLRAIVIVWWLLVHFPAVDARKKLYNPVAFPP